MQHIKRLGTGFAYDLNYRILEESGPTKASTVLYLLPIVAGALGWLLLNETVKPNYLVGVPVILAGVWLVRRPDNRGQVASRRRRIGL